MVKPAEGPIFIASNAMIDTLEKQDGSADHEEICDLLMECHNLCLPMIKPHMKVNNNAFKTIAKCWTPPN